MQKTDKKMRSLGGNTLSKIVRKSPYNYTITDTSFNHWRKAVEAFNSGIGNIGTREGVQEISETIVESLGEIIRLILLNNIEILYKSNLEEIISELAVGLYDSVQKIGFDELYKEIRHGNQDIRERIESAYGYLPVRSELESKMYTGVTVSHDSGYFELRVQYRYRSTETKKPCTLIRDQGFMFLVNLADFESRRITVETLQMVPIHSYAKTSQDYDDLRSAAGKLTSLKELEIMIRKTAAQQGFYCKDDGELVKINVGTFFDGNQQVYIAVSLAGSSFRTIAISQQEHLPDQFSHMARKVSDDLMTFMGLSNLCGLDEVAEGALKFYNKNLEKFEETPFWSFFGELIIPCRNPGSIQISDVEPYFQIHDPVVGELINIMGHTVQINPTGNAFNKHILTRNFLQVIEKYLRITFNTNAKVVRSRIIMFCLATEFAQAFVINHPEAKEDAEQLLLKVFDDLVSGLEMDLVDPELLDNLETVKDTILYRTIKGYLLPEGGISNQRIPSSKSGLNYSYQTWIKIKTRIWEFYDLGSCDDQYENVRIQMGMMRKMMELSKELDVALGDETIEATKDVETRWSTFVKKTGTFSVVANAIQELGCEHPSQSITEVSPVTPSGEIRSVDAVGTYLSESLADLITNLDDQDSYFVIDWNVWERKPESFRDHISQKLEDLGITLYVLVDGKVQTNQDGEQPSIVVVDLTKLWVGLNVWPFLVSTLATQSKEYLLNRYQGSLLTHE